MGIDAQELAFMLQAAKGRIAPVDVLAAATARAGEQVGLAPLGQLVEGARPTSSAFVATHWSN